MSNGETQVTNSDRMDIEADVESCHNRESCNPESEGNNTASLHSCLDVNSVPESSDKQEGETKANSLEEEPPGEPVSFKVVFNKQKYDVLFPLDKTVKQLKEHLSQIISVLPAMQKIMIKGLARDDKTLREIGVTPGSKVMVIGSKLEDVVRVGTQKTEETTTSRETSSSSAPKESLSRQKMHKKIIDKGVPEDALPGIKNCRDSLPAHPLSGMVNKHGGKVRLTFKLELDQLWIGTKERTEKINMSHIRQIVSEAIEGHEEYHIMGFQLGPTEASRYWVYWVPAQYVNAIKETVLDKW